MNNQAPLCLCGCGNQVARSKKFPDTWNKFYSRHGKPRRQEQFKAPPKCKCGCRRPVSWRRVGGGWKAYADGCLPFINEISNKYVTKQELMQHLDVSSRTIERRVKRNVLPEPFWVKVPNKPQLQVVFFIKDLISYGVIEKLKGGKHRWSKTT